MVGKHNNIHDSAFNKRQLEMGIKVEQEHTDSKKIAKQIAKDHLSEIPDYYTRLNKMEKEGLQHRHKAKKEKPNPYMFAISVDKGKLTPRPIYDNDIKTKKPKKKKTTKGKNS